MTAGFDPALGWEIHPQVALRPEPFGALAYHFGNRRLSFLKDPVLLAVVRGLAAASTATQACRTAGVDPESLPTFYAALGRLAASDMIRPATPAASPAPGESEQPA